MLDQVAAIPSDGLIFIGDTTITFSDGAYFQVSAVRGSGATTPCWVSEKTRGFPYMAPLAITYNGVNSPSNFTNNAAVTAGSVFGAADNGFGLVYYINTISAVKDGRNYSGTVKFESWLYHSNRVYAFSAVRVTQ